MLNKFKVQQGLSSQLFINGAVNPAINLELGCWYLCTDTADVFVAVRGEDNNIVLKRINAGFFESGISESISNSQKFGYNITTTNKIGYLEAGTTLTEDMPVSEILYKILFGSSQPPVVNPGSTEVVTEIINNSLPMYSINADGTIGTETFRQVSFTEAEAQSAPTESCFYQVLDDSGNVVESGYQDLQIVNDQMYYIVALPKNVDYENDVRIQAYEDDEQCWSDCLKLPLVSDPVRVAELIQEIEDVTGVVVDLSYIDTDIYTIYVQEDICTGSKLRFIITG